MQSSKIILPKLTQTNFNNLEQETKFICSYTFVFLTETYGKGYQNEKRFRARLFF